MHNNYDDKTLKAYCHYPLLLAEQDLETGHNDMYKITTINWTVATSENLKKVNHEHIFKNIYEMSMGEFLEWIREMEEVAEDVVSIEKIIE